MKLAINFKEESKLVLKVRNVNNSFLKGSSSLIVIFSSLINRLISSSCFVSPKSKQSIETFNLFECSKIKNIAFLVPVILSCNPKIKHFLFLYFSYISVNSNNCKNSFFCHNYYLLIKIR